MLDFLLNMTPQELFAQGIGVCAATAGIISFQQKTQKKIVFFQLLNNVLWTVHFLLLGALAGFMLNAVGIARGLVFYFRSEHKWAQARAWYAVFAVAIIGVSVFSWVHGDGPLALLPMAGMLCTTVSLALKDPFHVRAVSFFSSPCWLTYNAIRGSVPGMCTEAFLICSIIVGIVRVDLPGLRKKKQ